MLTHRIHVHAFWIYGVILGLSIEEAVKASVPLIINPKQPEDGWLETGRL
jgi:hypothetical protein